MIKSVASMQKGKIDRNEKLKMTAGILVGLGADAVISSLLKTHVPAVKGWRKIGMALGIFILSLKVGEDCENYFYKVWDETRDALKEAKTEMEKAQEEVKEAEADGSAE